MAEAVGLSVGATNMAAVVHGRTAVTRQSVLTLFRHRPPEVGVPSENPQLNERGLLITGFVDRVGDPVGIVAADGSTHRGEVLVADALRALLHTVTDPRPPPSPAVVTYPAHWRPAAAEAMRRALSALPELSRGSGTPAPMSDATAALTALQAEPGVPARGVVALCDFGGTGSSITLADAANGFQPLGPTVRHTDFSGDLVDQALLRHVMADLSSAGSVDVSGTSAIGALNRLRGQCRAAKERLSGASVTTLPVDVPGLRTDVRLTRNELDEEIRSPLAEFIGALQQAVDRSGIGPADLVAIASVGGGANIPAITTTLSQRLRLPVITTAQPQLAAAAGAALRAARGPADAGATALASAASRTALGLAAPVTALGQGAPPVPDAGPPSAAVRPLAWSEVDDHESDDLAGGPGDPCGYEPVDPYGYEPAGGVSAARPALQFAHGSDESHHEVGADQPTAAPRPWYLQPLAMVGLLMVLLAVAALGTFALLRVVLPSSSTSTTVTTPTTTAAPPPPAAPPATQPPPPTQTEPPTTVVVQEPPPVSHPRATPSPRSPNSPPVSPPPQSPVSPPPQSPVSPQPAPQPCMPPIPGLPQFLPPCPAPGH